jgi:hypothetical protein
MRPLAAKLLILACWWPAASAVDEVAPVTVGDLTLAPAGDLRDDEHRCELHPKARLGVGFESDAVPPPTGDGRADEYTRILAGMLVRYHPHPGLDADLDGELERFRFRRYPGHDTDGGLLKADVDRVTPGLAWHGDVGWKRAQTVILTTGEQVAQDQYALHASASRDSARWYFQGDAAGSRLDYRAGTSSFTARQGDHDTYDAGLRSGVVSGDDRRFLSLRGETVRQREPGRFNDCDAGTATVGWQHAASPRSGLHAELGASIRRYSDDFLGDHGLHDRTAIAPYADLGGTWSWQDGDHVDAHAYSTLGDGITSNATWSVGAEAAGHLLVERRLALDASADLSENRDGGLNHRGATVQRQIVQGSLAGTYAIAAGLATRLAATLIGVRLPENAGYHRLMLSLDVAYAY